MRAAKRQTAPVQNRLVERNAHPESCAQSPVIAGLIGPGRVGSRVLKYFNSAGPWPRLCAVANSRRMLLDAGGLSAGQWPDRRAGGRPACLERLADFIRMLPARRRVLIDVTGSPEVAGLHAEWLETGVAVVTANKWALAAGLHSYRRLQQARNAGTAGYWPSTTVGAGLPMLETIARLHRAGEGLHSLEGALSGTLTCLTAAVGRGQAFSGAVSEAHRQGLTEPDPRLDLSGLDVARKLVILARGGGVKLDLDDVRVESLVPSGLEQGTVEDFLAAGRALDDHFERLASHAAGQGPALCHVARLAHSGQAEVGLRRFPADHPMARLAAGENRIEIRTSSYRRPPITIAGPGAGIQVTALQVWSDLLRAAGVSDEC